MSGDDRDNPRTALAVKKYADQDTSSSSLKAELEDEHVSTFYGRERAVRGPAIALGLRLKNGTVMGLEYAHRTQIKFDPEIGIEAYYTTGIKVTIRGKHLRQLFEDMLSHMVTWVQTVDALHAQEEILGITGDPEPIVTEIIIEHGRLDVDTGMWVRAAGNWNSEQQSWIPRPALLN